MIDLHAHSTFSDGSLTPADLIALAERVGLRALALTDHNTLAGLPDFIAAAKDSPVEAVVGIEISTGYTDAIGRTTELHIVGLDIPESCRGQLAKMMQSEQDKRRASYKELADRLTRAGYRVSYEKICERTVHPNRAHFALALLEAGYVGSISEAFERLLARGGGFYIPTPRPDALYIIDMLRSMGAIPILAHPLLSLGADGLIRFLENGGASGLIGMETEYSTYTSGETATAKSIASRFSLCDSGGSDFHGAVKPDISLGIGRGGLRIRDEYLWIMRERVGRVGK